MQVMKPETVTIIYPYVQIVLWISSFKDMECKIII